MMTCPKCGSEKFVKAGRRRNGKQRWRCQGCGYRTAIHPSKLISNLTNFDNRLDLLGRYIITAAQNATPVHKGFFKSLLTYARHTKSQLIVIPYRYRNPTSQWTADNESHEYWDSLLVPHLYDGRMDLCDTLTILGDIKVQATAVSPLTGLEGLSGLKTGILGHSKIELKSIPTYSQSLPKFMLTTGSVTVPNYTDTKAGIKGDFHHSNAAVVVVIENKTHFHLRHLNAAKDGSFIDLNTIYKPDGIKTFKRIESLIMGDTHYGFINPKVYEATFGDGGIIDVLKPKTIIWHDLLDQYARNHHHRNNAFINIAKLNTNKNYLETEVRQACQFVNDHTPNNTKSIIVSSNHNDALTKWVLETDWKDDPDNAIFYLETALNIAKSARMKKTGAFYHDAFSYWAKKLTKAKVLERNESYVIKGIELSLHGDKGSNGARGNIKNISKLGVKTVIGHSHSPGITNGAYQVGTSTHIDLAYVIGPSSWFNTHCVIYPNGKRALINIIDGKWR